MGARDLVAVLDMAHLNSCPKGLKAVPFGGRLVVLGRSRLTQAPRLSRKSILKGSVERQRWLEQLMDQGSVLPALPGSRLSVSEVAQFLEGNRDLFDHQFAKMQGRVQFQITVQWDPESAAATFGCHGASFEALEREMLTSIKDMLDQVAEERLELPRNGETLSNDALLIEVKQEVALDQIVEKIDDLWSQGLRVRQIGPSPAVSFASIGVRKANRAALSAALQVFGFEKIPNPDELKAARRKALLAADPAKHESLKAAADLIQLTVASGGVVPPPMAFVWREGQANTAHARKDVA